MIKEETVLKEKLDDYYSEIFEKDLLEEIVDTGSLRFFREGEWLIDIANEMTHIPLILHGAVKVMVEDKQGKEIFLYYMEKGETCAISFVNCIHRSKSIFRVIAERDTEVIFIPLEKLDEWLVKYKTWRHFIIDSYHFRLIGLVHSIEDRAFMHLEDRLIQYLTEKVQIMTTTILKITHEEIAHDLCTVRPVISRLLKDLEKEGVIKLGRGRIVILNIQHLMGI